MRDKGLWDRTGRLPCLVEGFCRFGSKASFSGRSLHCGSAHRGANVSGFSKPLIASESPLTSLRGCGPKPPPLLVTALNRILANGKCHRASSLVKNKLAASTDLAQELEAKGIQGLLFPSVVGGDDILVVHVANCSPNVLTLKNEQQVIDQAKRIAAKHR